MTCWLPPKCVLFSESWETRGAVLKRANAHLELISYLTLKSIRTRKFAMIDSKLSPPVPFRKLYWNIKINLNLFSRFFVVPQKVLQRPLRVINQFHRLKVKWNILCIQIYVNFPKRVKTVLWKEPLIMAP